MEENNLAESLALLILVVILYSVYLFLIAPLAVWLILSPLGVSVGYMGRVSIGLGMSLLTSSISSSSKK